MRPLSQRLKDRELLQRGDLTLCWKARDAVLDRPVFVKVLNPALAKDEEIRARFEREAKAVARLDHPNLVRIYEYGEDPEEGMYMILEWIEGKTLCLQIASGKRFTGDGFVELAKELLSGLAALHSVGILHRDLKPENILVTQRKTYKITDFSLAALRDAPKLTHHEAIVGTPAYMAPEQAAGGQPTERSDLFSAGVVLYEAATGTNPLIGETMLDTLRKVRESDVSFEHSAIVNLPPPAREVLEHLLRKHPDDRPKSAAEALSILTGEVVEEVVDEAKVRYRNFRFAFLAFVVLVVGVILIWQAGKPDRTELASQIPDTTTLNSHPVKLPSDAETVPEFRNPSPDTVAEHTPVVPAHKRADTVRSVKPMVPPRVVRDTLAAAVADSVDVTITTEPWAHVFFKGLQIGTTPLAAPLKLPAGEGEIVLRNPAFPPIEVAINPSQSSAVNVRLADHVARIGARVDPWGELYIDGEHIGTTPLKREVYVSPGHHTVRIAHPSLGSVQKEIDASPGQVLDLEVNLKTGDVLVATDAENHP